MKWFKHESAANMDAKLQEVLLDYGLEGYGLYWYCLELVASNVEPSNLTFELEHDCRVIARNTGSTVQRIQEMMTRFVDLGLFESSGGIVTCLKLAKSSDDYTAKLIRTKPPQAIDSNRVLQSPTNSDKVPLEEKRIEENRREEIRLDKSKTKDNCQPSANPVNDLVRDVFDFWKLTMQKSGNTKLDAKRKSKIQLRLKDGYTVEQIKTAITNCSLTPHNMGANDRGQKYNDIELICRDAANLERFLESNPGMAQQGFAKPGFVDPDNLAPLKGQW